MSLRDYHSFEEKVDYLGNEYPCLCIHLLKQRGMQKRLKQYMDKSFDYQYDCKNYSHYVHGFLLPWLEQLREAGHLTQGKSSFRSNMFAGSKDYYFRQWKCTYRGEIDQHGDACGYGSLWSVGPNPKCVVIWATFFQNSLHGLCKC